MRLTKQIDLEELGYDYVLIDETKQPCANYKLGQHEDIEEELGIDLNLLPTLLKLKKGDKIYVIDETLVEAEVTSNSLIYGELMIFSHYSHNGIMYTPVCYYSEYGKTWALTKEELL